MQTKSAFGIKRTETPFPAEPKISGFRACPECGSHRVARGFDETVCGKCGLVLEDTVFVSGRMG